MVGASIRHGSGAAPARTPVLGAVGMMYALLGGDFLAVAQLAIYVGAVMVLIMFAIFMTPGQIDMPGLVGRGQRLGALLVAVGFGAVSIWGVIYTPSKIRASLLDIRPAEALRRQLLTRLVLPLET